MSHVFSVIHRALAADPALTGWLIAALLAAFARVKRSEDWERLKSSDPRRVALIQLLRAVSLDVNKVKTWLPVLFTGRPPSDGSGGGPAELPARPDNGGSAMRTSVVFASLVAGLLVACGGTVRQQAVRVSNVSVDVIDSGTSVLLARYCERLMLAAGREGVLVRDADTATGVRCSPRGPHANDIGTPEQRGAVAQTEAAWRPLLDRAEAVVQAQHVVSRLLVGGMSAGDGALFRAMGELVTAYDALRDAVRVSGLNVPAPPALNLDRVSP